jgi:uncharacterized protein with NRDE domain
MCTVSFVRSGEKIIITSNRDEQVLRPAIPPKNYLQDNKNIVFPKDPKAGGTWFAIDEHANVLVLLNGAAEKHIWNPPYRMSRGLIVLELIGSSSPIVNWEMIELEGVEPFTLILFEIGQLYQLRWNGSEKLKTNLDAAKNYVWSSSTLYPKAIREERSEWFNHFLETQPGIDENEMFNFHRYTENEDTQNGLVINRGEKLKTLSITQAVIDNNKVAMVHHDLIGESQSEHSFIFI